MASKKQDGKKTKKADISLTAEESGELEIILDRFSVQSPEGESLQSYLRSLHEMLIGRESLVTALIDSLGRNPSKVGFSAFLALKDLVEDKTCKRIIKQAGYRFEQRGFPSGEDQPETQKVVLIPKEDRAPIAHFLPSEDGFWFVATFVPKSPNTDRVLSMFADEAFQKVVVYIAEGSHRTYRDYIRKVSEGVSMKTCEIPIEHAARLCMELIQLAENRVTGDVGMAKRMLQPFYHPDSLPYVYELMSQTEYSADALANVDLRGLFEELPISWLVFPKEAIQPYREKVEEIDKSVLVVTPEIQRERSQEIIKKAADTLCVGRTRLLYQRTLEEEAMWLKLTGKEDLAASAWIMAQDLKNAEAPGDNPLVFQSVLLSMRSYWPEDFDAKKQDFGRYHETESGLIIP